MSAITTAVQVRRRSLGAARLRTWLPFLTLAVLYVVTVLRAPGYLESAQIGGLLQLAAILGVVAIGQTLVILIGGIDLSVGAVVTLTNLVTAAVLNGDDAALPVALAVSLAVGLAVGLVNGLVIVLLKVPDLVATLATMTVVTGVGYLYTDGAPRGTSSSVLNSLVTHRFAGFLTAGVLLWAVLAVLTIVVLNRSVLGRHVYATGLNREASSYAGVPVVRTVLTLYVVSGMAAALAGFLLTGYTGSSYLGSGAGYQLSSIAAVVLGGVSIFGGRGGYGGTVAGVLITVLLASFLRVVGIPQAGQNIAYGLVILAMLLLFTTRTRRQ
jgi:ribose transport system permease protein